MIICEECGEWYVAWKTLCPNRHNHITQEQKDWAAALVPDDTQYVGWVQ